MALQAALGIPVCNIGAYVAAGSPIGIRLKAAPSVSKVPGLSSPARGKVFRVPALPCSLQSRRFSTRRKTAKAISDLHLQQDARRRSLRLQQQILDGVVPLKPGINSLLPKYAADPLALAPPPSPPALFNRIHVSPAVATRRSPPTELLHAPPQRPVGRISSLKSAELAAAVLTCAQKHRENPHVWHELAVACLRRGPHLGAAEAALVLHGYAVAGQRVLPLLQCCVEALLRNWNDARLLDVARALYSVVAIFGVRETRLLRRCIDSFGPLLQRRGSERLQGLPPQESLQHLHTLALLLKAFASAQLPFPPLVRTATEALRAQFERSLPRQPRTHHISKVYLPGKGHVDRIFALPAIGEGSERRETGEELPPSLVLSLLESLGALGVRNEPLFHAFGAFLGAHLPVAKTTAGSLAAPASCFGDSIRAPEATHLAEEVAAYWGAPAYPYAVRKRPATANPRANQSGWSAHGHPPRAKGEVITSGAGQVAQHSLDQRSVRRPNTIWSLRHLSRAVKCLGAVGCTSPQLMAGWTAAVRHCTHRCQPQDIVLALEAARAGGCFCRPVLQQLLGSFARRAADTSLPLDISTLLSAAISAAQLPITLPEFWAALRLNQLPLSADAATVTITPSPDSQLPGAPRTPDASSRGQLWKPHGTLSVASAIDLVEAVALALPALPLEYLRPALPVLRSLQTRSLPLCSSLRLLGLVKLLELKAIVDGPEFAGCFTARRACGSGHSGTLADITEVVHALWGNVHLRVRTLLWRQKAEMLMMGREERELQDSQSGTKSWMGLVEGSLAGDWQLLELCFYAVLRNGVPRCPSIPNGSAATKEIRHVGQSGETTQSVAGACAWEVLRHARELIMARSSRCPLVFGRVEEAVAMLHLELLPYCHEPALTVAATQLFETRGGAMRQQKREAPGCLSPLARPTPQEPLQQEKAANEAFRSTRSFVDSDPLMSTSGQTHPIQDDIETWTPDIASLEMILSCFSSRLITAATPTLLHAARIAVKALSNPQWQLALQQGLHHSEQALDGASPARPTKGCGVQDPLPFGGRSCTEDNRVPEVPDQLATDERSARAEAELLCEICVLALDALEQRVPLLQANELAVVAAEAQTLLSSLFACKTSCKPKKDGVQLPSYPYQRDVEQPSQGLRSLGQDDRQPHGDSSDECMRLTEPGQEGELYSERQLTRALSALLQTIACRWSFAPATISSTGPFSSLNLWLRLGSHAKGKQQREPEQALRNDPSLDYYAAARNTYDSGNAREAARCKALLEALCPATSSEALRWLREMGSEASSCGEAHYRGAPLGAFTGFSTEDQVASPHKGSAIFHVADEVQNKERIRGCRRGSSFPGHNAAGRLHDRCIDMQQWLTSLSALHSTVQDGGYAEGSCAEARGLLNLPRHRDLALTWLSQVMRAHV